MVSVSRITLRVGASRKEGTGDYGSVGASCEVEVELHGGATASELMEVREQYLGLVECTVDDELARQRQAAGAAPRPAAAPAPAGKPRSEWGSADRGEAARRTDGRTGRAPAGGRDDEAPRSGKGLYAKLKDLDEQHDYGVFDHVNQWAKARGNDDRMGDWDKRYVADGWAEARRYLEALAESDRLQAARN